METPPEESAQTPFSARPASRHSGTASPDPARARKFRLRSGNLAERGSATRVRGEAGRGGTAGTRVTRAARGPSASCESRGAAASRRQRRLRPGQRGVSSAGRRGPGALGRGAGAADSAVTAGPCGSVPLPRSLALSWPAQATCPPLTPAFCSVLSSQMSPKCAFHPRQPPRRRFR